MLRSRLPAALGAAFSFVRTGDGALVHDCAQSGTGACRAESDVPGDRG